MTLSFSFAMSDELDLRARRRRDVRLAVVRAALRLFDARGFAATTAEDIVAAAGVSRSTFFRHFPTKEHVFFWNHDERLARFESALDGAAVDGPSVLEGLRRAIRISLAELVAQREADRALFAARERLLASVPAAQALGRQINARWEALLVAHLRKLLPQTPHAQLRARLVAGAVVGALHAAIEVWGESPTRLDLVRLGDEALDLLAPMLHVTGAPAHPGAVTARKRSSAR